LIAGNWKMNKTPSETAEFIKALVPKVAGAESELVVAVPAVCLRDAVAAAKGSNIKVCAQNMHEEEKGAFTGEISAAMLKDVETEYVIIGHSERRQYFGETSASVNKKIIRALSAGLKPIVCVGESLTQREQGVTNELVTYQLKIALKGIPPSEAEKVTVAYEPVWAIGTGETATSDQANEVCGVIRNVLAGLYSGEVAGKINILYGGSVTAENSAELFDMPEIDGGLVGGASIKLDDFAAIASYKR